VRIQAAQTVGLFAVLDFDHVAETTFKHWRTAGRDRKRQAFTWAMEAAAAANERIADQARRWLRDSDVGSISQRVTLVDAYSTRLGALFPDDALHAIDELIKDIASEPGDFAYRSWRVNGAEDRRMIFDGRVNQIAPIITEIFASGAVQQVLHTLNRWTIRQRVAHHETDRADQADRADQVVALLRRLVSAGAMARIARLPAPGPPGRRPPMLLKAVADGDLAIEQIIPVWQNALTDRYMGSRSWDVLRLWVQAPDNDPSLIEPVRRVVRELAQESLLQQRRLYHEIRQWKRRRGYAPFQAFPNI
jgi:hypothetical protein